MSLPKPTRREEARLPETGSSYLRRYTPVSLALHVAGLVLFVSAPLVRSERRPIVDQGIYMIEALVPAPVPNFEPPQSRPTPRKEPTPAKPVEPPEPKPKPKKPEKATDEVSVKAKKTTPDPPKKVDPGPTTEAKNTSTGSTSATEDRPVSMGRVDQQNFHHDYYLELLRSMLARGWDPPSGGTGLQQASVHFIVHRDGTVTDLEVVTSSGWSLYDRSALSAVLNARQFPPLPQAYDGDHLGLTVNFQRMGETP